MHKGLYWSQLITGIGIGLILASSIWIYIDHITIADALSIPRVGVEQKNTSAPNVNPTTVPTSGTPQNTGDLNAMNHSQAPVGENISDLNGSMPTEEKDLNPAEVNPSQGQSLVGETEQETRMTPTHNPSESQNSVNQRIQPTQNGVKDLTSSESQSSARTQSPVYPIVYSFIVDPGDSSERIASKLEAYGLASSHDFLQVVHAQNLDRKLKAGHYELTQGESLHEIIAKLTR